MQTHGSTNKSPNKLSVTKNKLTRWYVYKWGNQHGKNPHQVILRPPLPKFHYYHNKRLQVKEKFHYYHNKWLQVKESQYFIPTYSWTLTPIPNWTYSVVTISPFDARLPVRD